MKQISLLSVWLIVAVAGKAQFPTFADFEARPYYVNKSQSSLVKQFLHLYGLKDTVESWTAYNLANSTAKLIDSVNAIIDKLHKGPGSLGVGATNDSLIKLQDSVARLKEAKDFYRSINKFTG